MPEDQQGISPSDLLKTNYKNILLVGKSGIGKTAVVHQMLKLWAEKENRELDYMFYFDMRKTPHITGILKLEELLFSVFSEPDEDKNEVFQDIKKNSDSVTLIFDGVMDLPSSSVVWELLQKNLLPDAKIIGTCRSEVESDFLSNWECLRVEVKGFSEQSTREYLSKMLSNEQLQKVLCNSQLFTLCHVPVYALMVVGCFSFESSEYSPQPCTVTEIYLKILTFCIQGNIGKTCDHDDDFVSNKCNTVMFLAEAAFHATQERTVNLTSLPQSNICSYLSLLKMLLVQVGPTPEKPSCAFLHSTVQEFFAALWLLKNPKQSRDVLHVWFVK